MVSDNQPKQAEANEHGLVSGDPEWRGDISFRWHESLLDIEFHLPGALDQKRRGPRWYEVYQSILRLPAVDGGQQNDYKKKEHK